MSSREFSIRKKKKSAFYYVAYKRVESPTCSQWHNIPSCDQSGGMQASAAKQASGGIQASAFFALFLSLFFLLSVYVTLLFFFTQASPDSARHAFLAMICNDFNIKVVSATSKYTAMHFEKGCRKKCTRQS